MKDYRFSLETKFKASPLLCENFDIKIASYKSFVYNKRKIMMPNLHAQYSPSFKARTVSERSIL